MIAKRQFCRYRSCCFVGESLERLVSHNQTPTNIFAPLHQISGASSSSKMATDPGEIFLPFLENGKFSDFIIECQGVVFKVHRLVICTQSPMLAAACSGSFEVCLSVCPGAI